MAKLSISLCPFILKSSNSSISQAGNVESVRQYGAYSSRWHNPSSQYVPAMVIREHNSGAGLVVLSGREPDKNVLLLGYVLYMTHGHALILLFIVLLKVVSILLKVTTFGDKAQRATSSCAPCSSAHKAQGMKAVSNMPAFSHCKWGKLSAPVT